VTLSLKILSICFHYAEFFVFIVMLSAVILHVIMLNVVAPVGYPRLLKIFGNVDFKLKEKRFKK
jgi:hypothetical protein